MSRDTHVRAAGIASLFVLAAAILVVCRSGDAGPAAQAQAAPAIPADSLAVALLATVRGSDPIVCELAVRAVDGRHGWSSTADELAGVGAPLTALQRATIQWAVEGGDDERAGASATAVAPLATALADPDPCVRRMAALKLGRMRDSRGMDALRGALASADPDERAIGALGLGYSEDPAAIDALGGALVDRVRRCGRPRPGPWGR